MMKLDMLCLMGLFPDNYRQEIERDSISGQQNAADKLQRAIVKGLDAIDSIDVKIVNSLYIGSYPKRYRRMMIPTFKFSCFGRTEGVNIGFCNLTGLKRYSRYYTAKKVVEDWARIPSEKQKVLFIYAMTEPFMKIADYVKKKYGGIKVCVVVPDLPEYMNTAAMRTKWAYRIAKKLDVVQIRRHIRRVDAYVLLTDTMKEWFGYPIQYTVVEGIALDVFEDNIENREKTIIYAGGIKEEYGVIDLVNAFTKVNAVDWTLEIYGDGLDIQRVREIAANYPNIKVMGRVSNEEVVKAQRTASILVNPRKNQPFTRYSFPSKIMEYMASGTMMMGYKLDGVPDEYDKYYYKISEDGLEKALRYVMALPAEEREQIGLQAKRFVVENKNPRNQCQKIVSMLRDI
jgi:glycosyltransferase involved in cell wall biosynthesis